MKNLKRTLSIILALTLALSLCATAALADDEDDDTITPVTSLPVTKNLITTVKDVALPQEDFYIQMAPATDLTTETYGDVRIQSGLALKDSVLDFHFDMDDDDDIKSYIVDDQDTGSGIITKTKSFQFVFQDDEDGNPVTFTESGIYRYYVTEVVRTVGSTDENPAYEAPPEEDADKTYYINYDRTTYIVDLFVDEIDDEYIVTNMLVTQKATDASQSDSKPESVSFTNTIRCSNIKITKEISRDTIEYADDEEYTFYILIPEGGDTITLTKQDTIQAQRFNEDGTMDGKEITLTVKGKDIDADVVENGTKFTLKQGQYMLITAPVSMIYKVEEVIPVEEGYTIEATYTETGTFLDSTTINKSQEELITQVASYTDAATGKEMMGLCVRGTTNTDTDQIVFTNTREAGTLTGVNLDTIPYVVILLLAVAGCAAFFVGKRRKG
jgi:hypothetical protein